MIHRQASEVRFLISIILRVLVLVYPSRGEKKEARDRQPQCDSGPVEQ